MLDISRTNLLLLFVCWNSLLLFLFCLNIFMVLLLFMTLWFAAADVLLAEPPNELFSVEFEETESRLPSLSES